MKKIIVNSPKFGQKEILLDDDDFELVSKYNWCVAKDCNTFYACRNKEMPKENGKRKRKRIVLHRLVMGVDNPKIQIDHADRNGLNCQKSNLRICTPSQNMANRGKCKNSTSKYIGVCWAAKRKKWMAFLQTNGKSNNIGFYNCEIEAAKARDNVAKEIFGEFANLNFNTI